MTELETMQRAKMYLDSFTEGKDPLSGKPLPDGDTLLNPRYSRCLGYVAGILQQVIDNGGNVGHPGANGFALLTRQQAAAFTPSEEPLTISRLLELVAVQTGNERIGRIRGASLTDKLADIEFLRSETVPDVNGKEKKQRIPTEAGRKIGISTQMYGKNGEYTAVVYNANAQRFVVDTLLTEKI